MNIEELQFREKVVELVKEFQVFAKSKLGDESHVYLDIPHQLELQYRLWTNISNIKEYNAALGYVVLNDDTIICVNSSSYIQQYDGCKWYEVR